MRLLLGLFFAVGVIASGRAQEIQFARSALVQNLLPMVVNTTALVATAVPPLRTNGTVDDPGLQSSQQKRLIGSGFVIDPGGEIVTNYHVIAGAYEIIVTFSDGMQLEASIVAADRLSDIALLQVQPPHPLNAVKWGDSGAVEVGDPVLAIGNPLGVGLSVTAGIISAVNRDIMVTPYDDYIQTDAPINHGNSGGPLFNMQGEVVGVNTLLVSSTTASAGLGFALPSADARFVIGQLHRFGWIRPGWLGIKLQQVTNNIAKALRMKTAEGAIVADLSANGPAMRAGIEIGDVVLEYNHHKPSDQRELLRDMAEMAPDTKVSLTVLRHGTTFEVTATIAEWPREDWERVDKPLDPIKTAQEIPRDLGLTLESLSSAARVKVGLGPEEPGILITAVAPGTEASQLSLAAGDVIVRVQDREMQDPEDYRLALDAARAQHLEFVLLLILPQKQTRPGPEWRALQIGP